MALKLQKTQKAELLNTFFASVMTEEPPLIGSIPQSKCECNSEIHDTEITPEDVRKKLASLRKNKASGPDNIHVNVLREVLDFDVPLAHIFKSLSENRIHTPGLA